MRRRRYITAFLRSRWIWLAAVPPVAWAAIALAVALVGCAQVEPITPARTASCPVDDPGYDWFHEDLPVSSLPYLVVELTPERVTAVCLAMDSLDRSPYCACTSHRHKVIVLPINAPDWYLPHERKHEMRYDHH